MKKIISILLLICTLFAFTACSNQTVSPALMANPERIQTIDSRTPEEIKKDFCNQCEYYDDTALITADYRNLNGKYIKVDALIVECTKLSDKYFLRFCNVPYYDESEFLWSGKYYATLDQELKLGDQVTLYGVIVERFTYNTINKEEVTLPCINVKYIEDYNTAGQRYAFVSKCKTIDYNSIMRNPSNYTHDKIKLEGTVVQVINFRNQVDLRVLDKDFNVWYVHYLYKDGESLILEDDFVSINGTCDGIISYKSIEGKQITIPSIMTKYLEIVNK